MTGYTQYIHRVFNDARNSAPCTNCEHRESCWKNANKVIEAAIQGESKKDASSAPNAFDRNMSGKLCSDGKDSLIWLLMLSMYMLDNPPMVTPHRE